MEELKEFEHRLHGEDDLAEVLHTIRRYAMDVGVIRQGYFFTPAFEEPNSPRTTIYNVGFPQGWIDDYEQKNFREIDPIPAYTMAQGKLTYWIDAVAFAIGKPGVIEFSESMKRHGLEHGFGVPLYGPKNRNAFCFFDFGVPRSETNPEVMLKIRLLAQIAHQRICVLLERERDLPALSERENEVLRWMAMGKSNGDIGAILNISAETVRTYNQRIYQKLNTASRTSAAVKGLRLGILKNPGT